MSLWSHRDFRRLWVGDTISQFGSSIGHTVVPLLAAGALAATPFEMGVLSAATTAAFLVIGLPAGVWVDRLRRRPVMLTADLVRAALLLSVPVAWWAGVLSLAQLVVVSLLVGAATVMFDVAYQSYLPALVGRDQLVEGNTKLQTSQSVAHVSGPSLAGLAAQAFGAANGVLATGVGYLVSAWALLRIRTAEPEPDRAARTGLRREIGEGLRFVLGDRSLRAIALCTATANFFGSAGLALQVLFLTRHLDLSEGAAGLLLSVAGAGGLLGAVTAGWWTARFGQIRTIWLVLLVTNPLGLLIPLAAPDWRLGLFVVGELAVAYGGLVYNIAQLSYRQARCPDRLLGRMNASIRFVVWGVIPLGGLLGGALGGWIGIVPTLWIGFGGQALAGLWVFFSPLRGQRDLAEARTAEPERSPS